MRILLCLKPRSIPSVVLTITATDIIIATIMKLKDPASRQNDPSHLSPVERGRPGKAPAGEGDPSQIGSAAPPHPNPLSTGEREFSESRLDAEAELAAAALYRLMAWLSPAYPVGAFSYSSGIEWAVEASDIRDAVTLREWLTAMLADGGGFADAVFFVHAHRAAAANDAAALRAVAELAAAFVPSRERFLETTAQGRAFLETTNAVWPCETLKSFAATWSGPNALPVVVGVACAGHGIGCEAALHAFLHALAANWISAGVRLIPRPDRRPAGAGRAGGDDRRDGVAGIGDAA